jgi:hypothetical protein
LFVYLTVYKFFLILIGFRDNESKILIKILWCRTKSFLGLPYKSSESKFISTLLWETLNPFDFLFEKSFFKLQRSPRKKSIGFYRLPYKNLCFFGLSVMDYLKYSGKKICDKIQEQFLMIKYNTQAQLHKFTSDDNTSNYKMTLRRGFLYGKNKYVNSFFLTYHRENKINFRQSDDSTFFLKKIGRPKFKKKMT